MLFAKHRESQHLIILNGSETCHLDSGTRTNCAPVNHPCAFLCTQQRVRLVSSWKLRNRIAVWMTVAAVDNFFPVNLPSFSFLYLLFPFIIEIIFPETSRYQQRAANSDNWQTVWRLEHVTCHVKISWPYSIIHCGPSVYVIQGSSWIWLTFSWIRKRTSFLLNHF